MAIKIVNKDILLLWIFVKIFCCFPSLEAQKEEAASTFHSACKSGDWRTVKRHLDNGSLDPDIPDDKGDTGLVLAAYEGHTDVVRTLLEDKRCNVNKKNKYGVAPLTAAVAKNRTDSVKLLLEFKADPHQHFELEGGRFKRPILSHAVLLDNVEMVRMLLEAGCDPYEEYRTKKSVQTPYSLALELGNKEIIRLFEEREEKRKKLSDEL